MNQSDVVALYHARVGYDSRSKKQAAKEVQTIIDIIRDEVLKGNNVVFSNFGKFYVDTRKDHGGIDPRTGEKILIPSRKVFKFKPSVNLKNEVKNL